jgi:hypothetical protein
MHTPKSSGSLKAGFKIDKVINKNRVIMYLILEYVAQNGSGNTGGNKGAKGENN